MTMMFIKENFDEADDYEDDNDYDDDNCDESVEFRR